MIKNYFCFVLTCLFLNSAYCQSDKKTIDTTYFPNGQIEGIYEYDSEFRLKGLFKEFYPSGILKTEGTNDFKYLGNCLNCYENFGFDTVWRKMELVDVDTYKIGIWKEYHPNGNLKSEGKYDDLFIAYSGTNHHENYDGPENVYLYTEQLKTGTWNYYNEDGKLILKEEYFQGVLVFKTEYWLD